MIRHSASSVCEQKPMEQIPFDVDAMKTLPYRVVKVEQAISMPIASLADMGMILIMSNLKNGIQIYKVMQNFLRFYNIGALWSYYSMESILGVKHKEP